MLVVKRIIAKNRSLVASLLVGWLLLCALMPLMMVDMGTDMNMGMDMAQTSPTHSHHGMSSEVLSETVHTTSVDQHCCDVFEGSVSATPTQPAGVFFDLSFIAVVCSFFLLWGSAIGRINPNFYVFIPPLGPPLHQRLCVWLD